MHAVSIIVYELTDNANDVLGFSDAFTAWYTRKPVSVAEQNDIGKKARKANTY